MIASKSMKLHLSSRQGVLLAIAICLMFYLLMFTRYSQFIRRHFESFEAFPAVAIFIETLSVVCILSRTPLLSTTSNRSPGIERAVGLSVLSFAVVFGVMMAVAIIMMVVSAILGLPFRDN